MGAKALGAPAFVLYITDNSSPSLFTTYLDTTYNVFGIYTNTNSFSTSIVNKSIEEIAAELDATNFPAKIIPIARNTRFTSSDYLKIGVDVANGGSTRLLSNFSDQTSDGGYIFRLKKHSVKHLEESILRLLPPYRTSSLYPWYARIQNGIVKKKHNGIDYLFYVKEFNKQEWSLDYGRPYVTVYGENAEVINDDTLKVSRAPLYYKNNNIFIDVDGMIYHSSNIKDVDIWNGLIYTKDKLPTNKNIYVTYVYNEDSYLFKDINLNPTFRHNLNLLNTVTLFYMIPAESSNGIINNKTIFSSTGASLKSAINSIQDDGYPVLILGAIIVQSIKNKDSISLLDTRTRGGGLHEKDLESYLKEFEDLNFLWDVNLWDGIPYPGNAAAIFSVPSDKFEVFDISDLKNRVSKFLSPGIVNILDQKEKLSYKDSSRTNRLPTIYNSSFDGSSYWSYKDPIIIDSFTGLTIADAALFSTENNIISLGPEEYCYQKYIKTFAPSIIKYKYRTSLDNVEYTSWQEYRELRQNKQVGSLYTDSITIGNDSLYSQYKDIEVSVAHTASYNFGDQLESFIKNIFNSNSALYTNGIKNKYYSNLLSGYTESINYSGITKFDQNIVHLYNDNNYSGHITNVANAVISGLYTDISGMTFPRIYTTGWTNPTEAVSWTETAQFLIDVYNYTSGASYLSGYNAILNSVLSLNPYQGNIDNLLLNTSGTYVIPDKYYYQSGLWKLDEFEVFNTSGQYNEINLSLTDVDRYLNAAEVFAASPSESLSYYASIAAYSAGLHFKQNNTWYYNGSPFSVSPIYTFDYFGRVLCKTLYQLKLIKDLVPDSQTSYPNNAYNILDISINTLLTDILEYCGYISPDILYYARAISSSNIELSEKILIHVIKHILDINGRLINSSGFMYYSSNTTMSMNGSILLETIADMLENSSIAKNYAELIYKQLNFLYNRTYGFADTFRSNKSDDGTIFNGLIYLYNKWPT